MSWPAWPAAGWAPYTFAPGLAQRWDDIADKATDRATGSLTLVVQNRQSSIKDLDGRISDWDRRLEVRQAGLKRQFGQLEVALGRMGNQSSWLSGQIAGLPSGA